MDITIVILLVVVSVIVFTSKRHSYSFVVPENTSKEEIKKKVRRIFFLTRLPIPLGMLIVVGALEFLVAPRMRELYSQLGIPPAPITTFLPYVIVSTIVVSFFIVLRTSEEPSYSSIRTEEGNLEITPRFGVKQEIFLLILLGLLVGLLVYSYILPIYSLTYKF